MKTQLFLGAVCALLPSILADRVYACSVCINGPGGARLTDAFNWSVIFLMAMPYTILFSVLGFFFYRYRAAKKARGETAKAPFLPWAWIHKESGR
ncbi:MAG TPA: hypothetical protein VGL11_10890 [Candidatus Binatia bacterium]|jgi:hypothetical protein